MSVEDYAAFVAAGNRGRDYVGPPAKGERCSSPGCYQPALANCEGCGKDWCRRCWWRHSHSYDEADSIERVTP